MTGKIERRLERGHRLVAHGAFLGCLILVVLPVLLVDCPPIFDYANHLSRAHVIANLDRSAIFAAHFQTTSFLIPNVLADLTLLALLPLGGVIAAGKMLLVLTFVLTLSGAYALNRVLTGDFAVWPLFAALLLYNEGFFWGFLNYNLGLALLLWGVAVWLLAEDMGRRMQLAAGAAFSVLIFLAHLVAFGLYAVAIAAIEARRVVATRPGPARTLLRLGGSALQFLLPAVLFFGVSPSSGLEMTADFDFSIFGKIMPFARMVSSGNPAMDIFTLAAALGFVAAALGSRLVACHPVALLVGGLYLLLVATLPYTMMGSYFLDSRIVVALALVLAAGLHQPAGAPAFSLMAAAAVLGLVAFRSDGLVEDWRAQDEDYARVLEALDEVPRGSVLVTAVGHPFELGDWITTRRVKPSHEHTGHYATIRNEVLVPNIFARRGQNPLVFDSTLEELNRVAYNPVPRLFTSGDSRWLVDQVAPVLRVRDSLEPPVTGLYIIGYHVPCDRWPAELMIRPVRCEAGFSLVEVLPEDGGEPIP